MIKILLFLAIVTVVKANGSPNGIKYLNGLTSEQFAVIPTVILEDALLNCTQLIEKYGYPAETHEAETEDGYLVTMHRIPGGKIGTRSRKAENGIPVLLVHGLLSSSVDWIINGPEKALGYMLADKGYDVWMGNARGNFYSKKHTILSPKDPEFWKFSWNEIGYYDLPGMIDYILRTTGRDKLHYVGHSQGTTSFFVMGSERPEMNEKILSMHALGPAAYMHHAETPVLTQLAPHIDDIEKLFNMLGVDEFLPYNPIIMPYLSNYLCGEESKFAERCLNFLFMMCGYNPGQMNATLLPLYMSHAPAGASSRQLIHYGQEYVSEKFRKYDHGPEKNLEIYGSDSPPDYRLSRITSRVALHYSDNDLFVHPTDVARLDSELGNSKMYRVPMDEFNHIDYIWGVDARTLLYDRIVELMNDANP